MHSPVKRAKTVVVVESMFASVSLSQCVCRNAPVIQRDVKEKLDIAAGIRCLANVYLDFDFECGSLDVVPIEMEYICARVQHVMCEPSHKIQPPIRCVRIMLTGGLHLSLCITQ